MKYRRRDIKLLRALLQLKEAGCIKAWSECTKIDPYLGQYYFDLILWRAASGGDGGGGRAAVDNNKHGRQADINFQCKFIV